MKKFLSFLTAALVVVGLAGCSGNDQNFENTQENNSYSNLDLNNTNVIINTPESGEWHKLYFKYPGISADTFFTIQETAKEYCNSAIDQENIYCDVWLNDNENTDIKYNDMTDEDYISTLYMRCIDSNFYMDVNPANKIEIYDRKAVKDILNIDFNEAWSWRPYFSGSLSERYDLTSGNVIEDQYILNGKDVSVQDALAYALGYLNGNNPTNICSDICTYTPIKAEVYKFSENSYGYYFTFGLNYDNIPVDSSQGADLENYRMVSNTMKLLMLTDTSVDWIWTCALNSDIPSSTEICDVTIDYGKACSIISDFLSKEHIFKIKEAELLYCMREVADETSFLGVSGVTLEPMWQFTVTDIGIQEYSIIYLNVNACTGEVYVRYE